MATTRRPQKLPKKAVRETALRREEREGGGGPPLLFIPNHSSCEDDWTIGRNMRETGINKIGGSRQQSIYLTPTLNHKISLKEPLRAVSVAHAHDPSGGPCALALSSTPGQTANDKKPLQGSGCPHLL